MQLTKMYFNKILVKCRVWKCTEQSVCFKYRFGDVDSWRSKLKPVTGQMAQVVRCSLLVQEVWTSNPKLIKCPSRCQRLSIAVT